MTPSILGVWHCRSRCTPNRGTACSVSYHHAAAEELSNELSVWSLATACASAGEFKARSLKLRTLNSGLLHRVSLRANLHAIIEYSLLVNLTSDRLHNKSLLLGRANNSTVATARAVKSRNSHSEVQALGAKSWLGSKALWCSILFLISCENWTNCSMWANKCALITLNTLGNIPFRNVNCNTALLVSSSAGWEGTICMGSHLLNSNLVTLLTVNWLQNLLNVSWNIRLAFFLGILCISPVSRNIYKMKCINTGINSAIVHIYDILALLAVRSYNSILQIANSLLKWNNISQLEECRLHYHIETSAKAQILSDFNSVYSVEFNIVLGNVALHGSRQLLRQLIIRPKCIKQESTAWLQDCQKVILIYIRLLGAGNKVCIINKIWRSDWGLTKTQVGHGNTTGLLGVISEVCLSIQISLITDNLNSRLVGTYSTIGTETPELTSSGSFWSEVNMLWIWSKRCIGKIINNTNGKAILRCILLQFLKYAENLGRSYILTT